MGGSRQVQSRKAFWRRQGARGSERRWETAVMDPWATPVAPAGSPHVHLSLHVATLIPPGASHSLSNTVPGLPDRSMKTWAHLAAPSHPRSTATSSEPCLKQHHPSPRHVFIHGTYSSASPLPRTPPHQGRDSLARGYVLSPWQLWAIVLSVRRPG